MTWKIRFECDNSNEFVWIVWACVLSISLLLDFLEERNKDWKCKTENPHNYRCTYWQSYLIPVAIERENRRANSKIGNQFNGFDLLVVLFLAVSGDFDWTFCNALENLQQCHWKWKSFIADERKRRPTHWDSPSVNRRFKYRARETKWKIKNNNNNRLLLCIESWQLLRPRSILIVHNEIESYCLIL